MSKRFVDTDLIRKAWYRKLPCRIKALWEHLRLSCDASGVLDADWDSISFHVGEIVTVADLEPLKEQVEVLSSGKLFLKDFIFFQYGTLSDDCRPHQKIIELIHKNGIQRVLDTLSDRVQEEEEDKDKDKKRDKRGKQTDEEWMAELKIKFAYLGVNVDEQRVKAEAWISANPKRQFTRRFFVGWLSRCETKIQTSPAPAGNNKPLTD